MNITIAASIETMSTKEERFFKELGARIAELSKIQGRTQTQLAERLGIAQQSLDHCEVGRLRVATSMLPALAQAAREAARP